MFTDLLSYGSEGRARQDFTGFKGDGRQHICLCQSAEGSDTYQQPVAVKAGVYFHIHLSRHHCVGQTCCRGSSAGLCKEAVHRLVLSPARRRRRTRIKNMSLNQSIAHNFVIMAMRSKCAISLEELADQQVSSCSQRVEL